MDLLQYTDKSESIDERLKLILNEINNDYNSGIIKSETEYYYRIKTALTGFFRTLNKPMFQFREAGMIPNANDYNSMINEAVSDISYLIADCQMLGKKIMQSYASATLGKEMIQGEVSYLSKMIEQIRESISINKDVNRNVFTETFDTADNMGNISDENACTVNTTDGILSLKVISLLAASISNVKIDNEVSNGFPGNTHVVETLNGEMHYPGEDNLHYEIKDLLEAGSNTWYEFELIKISDQVRKECNSFGFEYDEGIKWITSDEALRLKLEITLSEQNPCSMLFLKPRMPEIKGIVPCIIEKIELISSSNSCFVLEENKPFDKSMVYPFSPVNTKKIVISFVQPAAYPVTIGHSYYTMVDTKSMSIFDNDAESETLTRVNGELPSINLLGVKYNPQTKWIEYPELKDELPDDLYIKQKLFKTSKSTIDKKAGQEILPAYRQMIGIERIKPAYCLYDEASEYISNEFYTAAPINSITLKTEEYIPGDDSEILEYFISIDNGLNWHKIYPDHRAYNGVYEYTINNVLLSNSLSDIQKKRSSNITTISDVYSVKLKIKMKQADIENKANVSPIVYSYKLIVKTGGEDIDI